MAPRGYIGVVGESHYQRALQTLLANASPNRIVTVGVEREPDNPFDSHAIRIFDPVSGETLGYLPRGTTGFARLLKGHGIERHAEVKGGTSDKPSIGLVLHLYGEQEEAEWHGSTAQPIETPATNIRASHDRDLVAQQSNRGAWASIWRLFSGR